MTAPVTTSPEIDRIELRIAYDLARRAALIAPFLVLGVGLWRGLDAAGAVVLALAVVVLNWIVAAAAMGWAARTSPNLLMAVALFGFLVRLGAITAIGVGIKALDIVDWPVFCVTLLVGYAVLLVWELRSISFQLANPGVRPKAKREVKPEVSR